MSRVIQGAAAVGRRAHGPRTFGRNRALNRRHRNRARVRNRPRYRETLKRKSNPHAARHPVYSPGPASIAPLDPGGRKSMARKTHNAADLSQTAAETTAHLIEKIREGDGSARDRLVTRYLPILTRWASKRLPPWARDTADTGDLVNDSLLSALSNLEGFEVRREGAFLAYLRQILIRRLIDHINRVKTRQRLTGAVPHPSAEPSPLEHAVGASVLEAYERGMLELSDSHRQAVFMHVELGFDYDRIALALDSPTANAARAVVRRGLEHLAKLMGVGDEEQ